jgi:uncharacterized membrane-anchored protein YhcB (DUF1043 family)
MDWLKANITALVGLFVGAVGGFFGVKGYLQEIKQDIKSIRNDMIIQQKQDVAQHNRDAVLLAELGKRVDRLIERQETIFETAAELKVRISHLEEK